MQKKTIVILGAGFGGLRVAMDLSRDLEHEHLLEKYEITLIDRSDCHVFIPLLYKIAGSPEQNHKSNCTYDISYLVKDFPVTFIQDEITAPNFQTGMIGLKSSSELKADYLVIALGSETNYFGIPGLKEHSIQLKNLDSARTIRDAVSAALAKNGEVKIVAGGGGPNGIEIAGEIRQWAQEAEKKNPALRVNISIVEAMPTILPGFDANIIEYTMRRLKTLKIDVLTGKKIAGVKEHEMDIENDGAIPFDILIWTGGTKIPELLTNMPVERDPRGGKPIVGADMKCLPDAGQPVLTPVMYAIGDNACFYNKKTKRPVSAVAHVAIVEGGIAAYNIMEEILGAENPKHVLHMRTFVPKNYPYVIPIGTFWAIAKAGPAVFYGTLGWGFSRLVEFYYLLTIMSPWKAFKAWQRL